MPSENPAQRFADILENIHRIEQYTENLDRKEFESENMRIDAVERCLSRISEAAVKLGEIAEKLAPDEQWANIRGFGNHLRHGYDGVDSELVWFIVRDALSRFKTACADALKRL